MNKILVASVFKIIVVALFMVGFVNSAFGQTDGQTDLNVVKTCDPITPVASGPMTLNCQLVVSGDNFTNTDNLILVDHFTSFNPSSYTSEDDSVPPPTAPVIIGTMGGPTSIVSSQQWSCQENLNATFNVAYCLLSGADMIASGGSSTIDTSFDFTVANDVDQVTNCALFGVWNEEEDNISPLACVTIDVPDYTGSTDDPNVPNISDLDPDITSISKTCEVPVAGMRNGVLGMLWDCQIDVTTDTTPFAGNLVVLDSPGTSFGNTVSQITSISSVSGNFDCSNGQSCTISGADFDSNGEVINVSLFATSDEINGMVDNTTYVLQNCAQGQYLNSNGVDQTIAGNCVTAPWEPVSSVIKTCEPVMSVTSGPMTLNCQITVTGSDLPTNGPLLIMDGFVAALPANAADATVNGSMMNPLTSTEAWTCLSQGNLGMCELSSADLFAAGGTSIIDMSFQFDVQNNPAQVANCVQGSVVGMPILELIGETAGAQGDVIPSNENLTDICVVIDLPVDPDPKINLKKSCAAPQSVIRNGVQGFSWTCDINLDIVPTPFAGTFTLYEDASNINVGAAEFTSSSVPCQGIGTDQLACEIDGATAPSSQIIQVELFTAQVDNEKVIEWENCASGNLEMGGESASDVSKSCVQTRIKPEIIIEDPPKDPPKEVFLKKSCKEPEAATYNGVNGVAWSCEVSAVALPAPFAGVFTFTEDATGVSGSNNANIVGINPDNNAWSCSPAVPTQQTDCTISGADFSPSGVETIMFDLFAQTYGDKPLEWRNCVGGVYTLDGEKREIKGNCEEMTWKPTDKEPPKTAFDITKTCKASSKRQQLSNIAWLEPYQCTITVTTNGVPFTDPIMVVDALTFGNNSASSQVQNITSNDPWQCVPPPFAAVGQGNQPACVITSADFPHNIGSSTLTVNMVMHSSGAALGSENCANLVALDATGQLTPITSDCVTIFEAPDPDPALLDVVKTCETATKNAAGLWEVDCKVTVTGQNLPAGEIIRVMDELVSASPNYAQSGNMSPNNNINSQCGGGLINNGFASGCDIYVDDLATNGGTIVFDYRGTINGPGGFSLGQSPGKTSGYPQNCAYANIASAGIHGPNNATGKSCVDIPLELSLKPNLPGVVMDKPKLPGFVMDKPTPVDPTPPIPVDPTDPTLPTPTPVLKSSELRLIKEEIDHCVVNRDTQKYECGFQLTVTNIGQAPYLGPVVISNDFGKPHPSSVNVTPSKGGMRDKPPPGGLEDRSIAISSLKGWTCDKPRNGGIACINPNLDLQPGQSSRIDMSLRIPGLRDGGRFQSCAVIGVGENRAQRVALVQAIMNQRGLNAGPVDGQPGRKTYAALAQLQEQLGLPQSREFDDALFKALGIKIGTQQSQSCAVAELPVMPKPLLRGCKSGYSLVSGKGCVKNKKPDPVVIVPPKPRCENGLPRVNGQCVPIKITPKKNDAVGDNECRIKIGGICIK